MEKAKGKLKNGKATGEDGIGNKVWKYWGGIKKIAWEVCNMVWRGDGWLKEWKIGIIVPMKKEGDGRRVEDYRGVTLLNTLYKIYQQY